jgi:regulator of protease activity HflC (stomatin/prohibitin superfamily)
MWAVALILIATMAILAATIRTVPADSVGVVERLGRFVPPLRRPGVVVLRPFIERLVPIPISPFPIRCALDAEIEGLPAGLLVSAECLIQEPVKFHQNVPARRYYSPTERTERFLNGLLASEGRAVLREMTAGGRRPTAFDFARSLSERLGWHARSVGMRISDLRVSGLDGPENAR